MSMHSTQTHAQQRLCQRKVVYAQQTFATRQALAGPEPLIGVLSRCSLKNPWPQPCALIHHTGSLPGSQL